MKQFLPVFIFLFLVSCSKDQPSSFQSKSYVPPNAQIILCSPDILSFRDALGKNQFLKEFESGLPNKLSETLSFLEYYKITGESVLSLSEPVKKNTPYIYAGKLDSVLVNLDSIAEKQIETIKTEGYKFQKISLDNSDFTLYQSGDVMIFSNDYRNILTILKNEEPLSPELDKIFHTTDPKKNSLCIKNDAFPNSILEQISGSGFQDFENIAHWIAVDIDISESELVFNGISIPKNDSKTFNVFSGSNPSPTEILEVVPQKFQNFYSVSLEDFSSIKITDSTSLNTVSTELENAREIAFVQFTEGNAVIFNFSTAESAEKFIAGAGEKIDDYRNFPINSLEQNNFSAEKLSQIIPNKNMTHFTIIDHFVVEADSSELLQEIILAKTNKKTFAESAVFQKTFNLLSSSSNQLFLKQLKNGAFTGMQLIYENDYAHFHAFASVKGTDFANTSSEVTLSNSFKLESALATNPAFFKNHNSDQMDIAVQDNENLLHLISNKGTVFWKKKLETRIESAIYEVDLFKNGYKQLAFNTGYNLVVLDRNDNNVKPFPVEFNDALTQPVAVFDYDHNRNYRFVLTQNKSLYMIGPKGQTIKGFDFGKASSAINKTPKHIRLGNKDYILVSEESGKLNILSRQGTIRVPFSEKIEASTNDWYGYKGKFVTFSKNDQLVEISQNSEVKQTDIGLAENARLVANEKNLVYLSENQLHINEQIIELDYGLYSNLQLLEVDNRTFISIRDTQTQKIYLFDDEANLLEGFPVFGTSQVDIANADVDSKLELVTKGEENEILIYEF